MAFGKNKLKKTGKKKPVKLKASKKNPDKKKLAKKGSVKKGLAKKGSGKKKSKKKGGGISMDFGKTVFLFVSVLFIAWWVGAVMKAEGEDQYVEACRPISLTTKYIMKITTGLTGFTPKWTVTVKKKLDGGCYYFFATFILNEDLGEGTEESIRVNSRGTVANGGVHK